MSMGLIPQSIMREIELPEPGTLNDALTMAKNELHSLFVYKKPAAEIVIGPLWDGGTHKAHLNHLLIHDAYRLLKVAGRPAWNYLPYLPALVEFDRAHTKSYDDRHPFGHRYLNDFLKGCFVSGLIAKAWRVEGGVQGPLSRDSHWFLKYCTEHDVPVALFKDEWFYTGISEQTLQSAAA